jgi:lipoprotein signal peptidase
MRNGYALASHSGLIAISDRLRESTDKELDDLRKLLRIGIQWNTQVTLREAKHTVSQAYCSALPIAYSSHALNLWEKFARLVLEASYEATICAAILNSRNGASHQLFLTLLGGGAFGNAADWIVTGIQCALNLYEHYDLDVAIVSHGSSKPCVQQLVDRFSR